MMDQYSDTLMAIPLQQNNSLPLIFTRVFTHISQIVTMDRTVTSSCPSGKSNEGFEYESIFFTLLATSTTILSLVGLTLFSGKFLFLSKPARKLILGIKTILEDLFLVIFTAAWLLLATGPYGALLTLRGLVYVYLKIRYRFKADLVTGLDAIGILDTENSKQIIKSIKVLGARTSIEELRTRVLVTVNRLDPKSGKLVYPKFHQYLDKCCGFFCWKPSEFDINYHVRLLEGQDENNPTSVSESEALKITGEISNEAYPKKKANWEIILIPKFHYDVEDPEKQEQEKSAIMIRIHHGIGDGYSLMKLILRDMANIKDAEIHQIKSKKRGLLYGIAAFFYILLKSPRAFYKEMMMNDYNPLHNDKIEITGKKTVIWSDPIDVKFLKEVKNKMNSGMSVILLSSVAGSLCRYIKEEYGSKWDSKKLKSLSALLPMPAPNHPDNKMVNKFSVIIFPLPYETENPVERSKEIMSQAKIVAQSPDAPLNLFLMNLCGVMPSWFSRHFIVNKQCTVVVSNIPGPTDGIAIWEKRLMDTMFWLPHLGNSGISISLLSYTSHLRIGLTTDSGVIKDELVGAQRILSGMIDELKRMGESVNIPTNSIIRHLAKCTKTIQVKEEEEKEKVPAEEIEIQESLLGKEAEAENVIRKEEEEIILEEEDDDDDEKENENDSEEEKEKKKLDLLRKHIIDEIHKKKKSTSYVQESVRKSSQLLKGITSR